MNPAGDYPLHPDPEQNQGIQQWTAKVSRVRLGLDSFSDGEHEPPLSKPRPAFFPFFSAPFL